MTVNRKSSAKRGLRNLPKLDPITMVWPWAVKGNRAMWKLKSLLNKVNRRHVISQKKNSVNALCVSPASKRQVSSKNPMVVYGLLEVGKRPEVSQLFVL